jgi:hypothetical protein
VDADQSGGNITIGNVILTASVAKDKTGALASLDVTTDEGSVTVGNITVIGESFRGKDDTAMLYEIKVSIDAELDITVGNITVQGGDGVADNLTTLKTWLDLDSSSGKITVGNIDYSDWAVDRFVTTNKTGATIDVSTWRGAESIVGSQWNDTIYDNRDTNTLTGGDGADLFIFSTQNTGKTLATMDKILDFNAGDGDTIDVNTTDLLVGGNYLTFAAFVAAADGADKGIFAGTITGQSGVFLAIDHNTSGVDYMIQLVGVDLTDISSSIFV